MDNLQGDENHLRPKRHVFVGRDIKKTFPRVFAYDALRQKLKTCTYSFLESLPLLDDIRLFRAVVLVDQFLVALRSGERHSVCDTVSAIR